jgi:predicted regulator of Ras-like GTPase activity (Roadblock/LC7/MglB family)
MSMSDFVILEGDYSSFTKILEKLARDSNAKLVFLLDKNGQQIASAGDLDGIDPTSLASLTAGNVAATEGLAQLVGEQEFSILFHEGQNENLHINVVGGRAILLVQFDERSSLGLVRLRVKKATVDLSAVLKDIETRSEEQRAATVSSSPFSEITDDDIDALFS